MAALLETRACSRIFCLVRAADTAAARHRVLEVSSVKVPCGSTQAPKTSLFQVWPQRSVELVVEVAWGHMLYLSRSTRLRWISEEQPRALAMVLAYIACRPKIMQ